MKKSGIMLEKLSYDIANWSRAQAQNRMTQLIGEFSDKIELVLANNDDMALGALDAYEKLNFTETSCRYFLGSTARRRAEGILDGRMAGTVYNDKDGQAQAMAKLAVALAEGEEIPDFAFENEKYIYLPYEKVTKENVGEFMD